MHSRQLCCCNMRSGLGRKAGAGSELEARAEHEADARRGWVAGLRRRRYARALTAGALTTRLRRLAAASSLLAAFTLAACGEPADPNAPAVRVVVPNGSSFGAAAESLANAGVIDNARMFRLYAKFKGEDRSLKPGTYELQPGTEWSEVLEVLSEGRSVRASITIPEGWDIRRIAPLVATQLEVPEDSVMAAMSDSLYLQRLAIPTETVEGYLFPATYQFPLGTSAREAVETMLQEFEKRWAPEWNALADSMEMSRHEVVTLASIVEKEARVGDERPTISAVYHNRLRIGMALQADPTVQYARGSHTSRVLFRDLEIDSPYNTYRNPGLPPGPIASPGSASLEAALAPANVDYLYFVARPDGRHEFRRTFQEHAAVAREMRRLRDSG